DSNFHGFYPTATSTLRVYQFRHDRTSQERALSKPIRACEAPHGGIMTAYGRMEDLEYARALPGSHIVDGIEGRRDTIR
ncbi:MAG: hypothetical protein AAF479_04255, partial [Pseudomonadota bacterium]